MKPKVFGEGPETCWESEGAGKWWVRASSATLSSDVRQKVWIQYCPKDRALRNEVKEWVAKTLPADFYGCEVTVETPIHLNRLVVDPDTRVAKYVN